MGNVWHAFAVLSTARTSNGFGPNPIPVSEILVTADFFEIDPADALYLIQGLDSVFLEEASKKAEAARAKTRR